MGENHPRSPCEGGGANMVGTQLCALSTVGIAPSGLALGRVERTQKPATSRTPHDQPLAHTQPTDVRPQTSRPAGPNAGRGWALDQDKDADLARAHQNSDLRRASLSFSAARLRRRGQTLTSPPLRIPENEPADSHTRRPSTGWLRRLSIASFQTETPSASSPVTPSFNGSASPILPRPSSQRRAPNKLVKRSPSQHSNSHPLFVNTTSSPSSSALRRPATSYQRSESMRLQSPLATEFASRFSERFDVESPAVGDFDVDKRDEWVSYLLPKSEKFSEKLARKLPTAGGPNVQGMGRIISNHDTLPALVLASAITTNTTTAPRGNHSVPETPVDLYNPFQAANTSSERPVERPTHKHSYSLNDANPKNTIVTNTVTASGTPIPGRPRGGSLKRVKGRTFSIPRSELSLGKSVPSSPQPLQRRHVTDPTVSHHPQAVPLSDWALAAPDNRGFRAAPRSVSHDYNIGLRRQRPLTSDAVTLSTWQHVTRPESYTYSSLRRRPKRHSIAASDPSSTIIGSDDTRVFTSSDEYETDIMSDYWDSVRTRETSTSGLKGLCIETMFDKAGAQLSEEEVATLEELLPRGSFASRSLEKDPQLFTDTLLASPPLPPAPMNDNASVLSDVPDEDACSMIGALPGEPDGPSFPSPIAYSSSSNPDAPESQLSVVKNPPDSLVDVSGPNQKMNIFDWSEQARPDRDMSDSETRPRTVHGKQIGVNRGSRAACRKAPSTVHLRSQSVPVARDLPASDSRQSSGKFGTWGLGSKGVSEDWDSDFDFDDTEEVTASQDPKPADAAIATQSMTVPRAILERQASLRGQFGQVQELTLLVEELKRLRHQAGVLDLLSGPSSELWKEAEGIVNLATIDEEDDRRSPPGSPSSLTFSFDESDEEGINASKRNSEGSWQGISPRERTPSNPPFEQQLSKDSPKSKSVLDILQPKRSDHSSFPELNPAPRSQKLPFDTQSLRDLVVRAGVVTRALKEVIRKAEGVATSPQDMFPSDPPFRRIFDQSSHDDLASFEAALAEMQ
ncbi:hypothetical protein NUU61_009702 [Penicillium alfredii]|uniref:Uncharacterized protein n=1 Tax=Penicillium alfredii TaxID=1506179 RepID=A0A9W9EGL6_9EURO|nr:uncharacterized protein NUU61_009702 [Penicillium alfredii]KAJ5081438.1 hypothetical protein NUU61_009702 [Penicillium alfredii]